MGGDATENVEGRHQVTRKCAVTTDALRHLLASPSGSIWTLARERPCWARHCTTTACPEILRVLGARAYTAPPPLLLTSRVVDFSQCRRPTRVGFSPSSGTCPDIFRPRLGLLTFPEGWRPTRVGFSPSPGAHSEIFCPLLDSLAVPATRAGFSPSLGANLGVFCSLPEQLIFIPG